MDQWWVSAAGALTTLCLLGLLLIVLCPGTYLLLLKIKYKSRIRRRAQHDYRSARGTQHLRQLRASLSALRGSMRARQARIENLEKQLEILRRKRSAELNMALSKYLVNERLTEVPGIGPRLSRRIIQHCFRGNLRDLRFASRVRGVGPSRQRAIMAWVYAMERLFPYLLAADWDAAHHLAAHGKVLRRSSSESHQGLVVGPFLVLLSGKTLGALPSNLTQIWQWGVQYSSTFWSRGYREEDTVRQRLVRAYAERFAAAALSADRAVRGGGGFPAAGIKGLERAFKRWSLQEVRNV